MEDIKITKASSEDIPRIMELVYTAYEVYIGNSGSGFVTRDTVIYRYKNTKNIEENLNHYYLMKWLPQNIIIGVFRAIIKNGSQTVILNQVCIDPSWQVCHMIFLFNYLGIFVFLF